MARDGDEVNGPLIERQIQFQQQMERIYTQQRHATRLFVVAVVAMCGGVIWLIASVVLLLTGH